jgi:excinuclease ABC subunit A
VTGLSGSGKSSLAFDTLYAEGQRRYVESLSAYARQFLGLMEKPDVDLIEGLSPAIAIEQRKAAKNPRSTVATVTEIYDYLRLLFARIGVPHCPKCGIKLKSQTVDEIVDHVLERPEGSRVQVLAPLVRGRKGEYRDLFERLRRKGFVRVRVDGTVHPVEEVPALERYRMHTIEIVVDRLVLKEGVRSRLSDSVEQALREAEGHVTVLVGDEELLYSEMLTCLQCGFSMPELEPRLFSFNSPFGACKKCSGLGVKLDIAPDYLINNPELTIPEGALKPWGEPNPYVMDKLRRIARRMGTNLDRPWGKLSEGFRNVVLYGRKDPEGFDPESPYDESDFPYYEGLIPYLWRRHRVTESDWVRGEIERYMLKSPCPACHGARLKPEALSVKIREKSIHDVSEMSVERAIRFFNGFRPRKREAIISKQILKEIKARLSFLNDVGVTYLTLDRPAETLSAGEDQRVRLATQIGSGLTGVLYVLDEPSIGLHPRDTSRLLDTLLRLRNLGNTVLVVEHDRLTMEAADWIIDLGPGAGEEGGHVVTVGTPPKVKRSRKSLTGKYLSRKVEIPVPEHRTPKGTYLEIKGARQNNLQDIDVRVPLGVLVCVTGVSGSGKSSLVEDTLYRALMRHFHGSRDPVGEHDAILGLEHVDKVVNIDQSPIGRTPRSNPATYTGLFTPLRELFSSLPEAKMRGYRPGRFSFNVKGGRCEACEGDGFIKIQMQFLPDVYVPCEVCKGKRYNRETLEVKYRGLSVADVLGMSVRQALKVFKDIPRVTRRLKLLDEVGLGYVKLGQPATTLSGGEAQRVKLAKELSRVATGRTLYILDEPTTGLHFEDVRMLLSVLRRLVAKGNTVLIIEHNLDVVKSADWIIDLGPDGGEAGGRVVAEGPLEVICDSKGSHTGRFLREELGLART